jgi:hypothetical protein
MTVMAVPVMYSVWIEWAHPITPARLSHSPNARKFARSMMEATGTATTSLRILMVMIESAFPCMLAPDPS